MDSEAPPFRKSLAVVIGIDEYGDGIPRLRSAMNDARRLGAILADEHGYEVTTLLDADATKAAIEEVLLRRLPDLLDDEDRALVYFAGHGVALDGDEGPNGFILPQDARPGDPTTYVEMTWLADAISALTCRHMLVVLDSCFSGAFRWSSMRDLISPPEVVHQERYERFVHDPAWQVITSAAADQTASDQLLSGNLGSRGDQGVHSPFALALFDALAGGADLAPAGGDGIVTATELYLYLEETLQPETMARGIRQTPGLWPLRKHGKGEFIFRVPGRALDLPPAPPLTFENNPYRGLAAYEKADAPVFFGRETVVEELSRRVAAAPLTVVLGASGTGKSSVVKAGVLPALEKDGAWRSLPVARPGTTPFQALARSLSGAGAPVDPSPEGILEAVRRLVAGEGPGVVLVLDQLEELVTLVRAPETRVAFLELVAKMMEVGGPRLRIVVTLRSDFEANFDRSALEDAWRTGRYVVPPMSRQDFRAVIEGPASLKVLYFEPYGLVETLLDEVVAMPGGLPLLSFTLSEMYRRYVERGGGDRSMTQEDYDALGGVVGALRSRADAEFSDLDDAHQASLRRLMLRMVVMEQGKLARQRVTRRALEHWDPEEGARLATVVERLSDARLVVEDVTPDGIAYVEPAHDALVNAWGRLLDWTHEAENQEPDLHFLHALERTAEDWDRSEPGLRGGLLWRDKVRSHRLWSLRRKDRIQLNAAEDRFCRASIARRRFIRNGVAALVSTIAVAGLVAMGLGFVAEQQRMEALAQRDEAQRQTRAAWSNELRSRAVSAIDGAGDMTVGFKLAAAAWLADTTNTAAAMLMRKALYGPGLFRYQGRLFAQPFYREVATGDIGSVLSPDGRYVATFHFDADRYPVQRVEITAVDGTSRVAVDVRGVEDGAGFTADGAYLILGEGVAVDLAGHVVSRSLAETLTQPAGPMTRMMHDVIRGPFDIAMSADGRIRAGHGLGTGETSALAPFRISKDDSLVNEVPGTWPQVALSWDGHYVATASPGGSVYLWEVVPGAEQATPLDTLWRGSEVISGLQFSADGSRLLVEDDSGLVRVWELTANPVALMPSPADEPTAGDTLRTPDGRYTLTHAFDGGFVHTYTLADAQTGESRERVVPSGDSGMGLGPDGLVALSGALEIVVVDPGWREEVSFPSYATLRGFTRDGTALRLSDVEEEPFPDEEGRLQTRWSGVATVPITARRLLEEARARDQLTLTPRQRETSGAAVALASLDALGGELEAPGSLFALLFQSVGRLAGFGTRPAPVPADTTQTPDIPVPSVDLPRAWAALQPDPRDTTTRADGWPWAYSSTSDPAYQGQVRSFLSDLKHAGAFEAARLMGAPEPFVSGPHSWADWVLWSEDFGRYDPAFVRWGEEKLIPNRDDALRLLTQTLYDKGIWRQARIHALALAALARVPELRARVAATYDTVSVERGAYLEEALDTVSALVGYREEGEPRDVVFAAGFWIRRDLDGTTPDFQRALGKLLSAYDPDFRVTLAGDPDTSLDGLHARLFWETMGSAPLCSSSRPGYVFGTRDVYCLMRRTGVLRGLEALAEVPVFVSGPHDGSDLDLHAATFGHYNGDFVRWASRALIPAPGDSLTIAATRSTYDRLLRDAGRGYWLALETVEAHPEIFDPFVDRVRRGREPVLPSTIGGRMSELPKPAGLVGDEMGWHYATALAFWVRRTVDGTRPDFEAGLRRLLDAYDPEFLRTTAEP